MGSLPPDTTVAPVSQSFVGLSIEEREQLAAWSATAREKGIEAVEDLGERPWPVPTEAIILGIYRHGDRFASWLIVGRSGDWALASCTDGAVISTGATLAEVLAGVFRASEPVGSSS